MSEEKGRYLGEIPESNQYVIRDENPISHFSQIPNLVDDMNLTPFAYRLYGHLKRVAGENGKCWQSTETLAKACGMSAGKVSDAKKELENVFPPLIRIVSKEKDDGRTYHEIFISDIWKINHDLFTKENPVHLVKGIARSPGETYPSRGERKNIPTEQEEPNSGAKIAPIENLPLEWQIGTGQDKIILPTEDQNFQADCDIAVMNICRGARNIESIAMAFMTARHILPTKSQYKGWRSVFLEMYALGVNASHISEAVQKLAQSNMTVADPFAVKKTAVALANPMPETPVVVLSDVAV